MAAVSAAVAEVEVPGGNVDEADTILSDLFLIKSLSATLMVLAGVMLVITLAFADDWNGGGAPTYVVAVLSVVVGSALIWVGIRDWFWSTRDDRDAGARAAMYVALAAMALLALTFVGFDQIRSAFEVAALKKEAGNRNPITSGWATVWGMSVGSILFLVPTLTTVVLQRSPDTAPRAGRVFAGLSALGFTLGTAGLLTAYGGQWVPELVGSLANRTAAGLLTGSILAVASLGLSLVFGVLKLVNFAHAQFLLIGAYLGLLFNSALGWNIWLSVIPAVIVGAVLGVGSDIVLWKPMREKGITGPTLLILSAGFGLLLQYLVQFISRGDSSTYDIPREHRTPLFGWDKVQLTPTEYILIVTSVALVVGIALLLTLTKLGKAVRAAADSASLAAISGIDVNRVILYIWIIAGGLAAYGGVAASLQFNVVTPILGIRFILPIFAAVIVGGLGTAYGPLLGGLVVGISQEVAPVLPFVSTEYQEVVGFVILIAILLVRPQGLLGTKERI